MIQIQQLIQHRRLRSCLIFFPNHLGSMCSIWSENRKKTPCFNKPLPKVLQRSLISAEEPFLFSSPLFWLLTAAHHALCTFWELATRHLSRT